MSLLDGGEFFLLCGNDYHLCQSLFDESGTTGTFVPLPFDAYSSLHCRLFSRRLWIYVERRTSGEFWRVYFHGDKLLFKGQNKSKWFFQVDVSSKKQTIEFYFTTMKPQVDLFSFVCFRKLKTPKRHFKITWPLIMTALVESTFHNISQSFMYVLTFILTYEGKFY